MWLPDVCLQLGDYENGKLDVQRFVEVFENQQAATELLDLLDVAMQGMHRPQERR